MKERIYVPWIISIFIINLSLAILIIIIISQNGKLFKKGSIFRYSHFCTAIFSYHRNEIFLFVG